MQGPKFIVPRHFFFSCLHALFARCQSDGHRNFLMSVISRLYMHGTGILFMAAVGSQQQSDRYVTRAGDEWMDCCQTGREEGGVKLLPGELLKGRFALCICFEWVVHHGCVVGQTAPNQKRI